MIVEIEQMSHGIEVSYFNKFGAIDIAHYKVCDSPYQYPIWELSNEVVPEFADIRDYKDRPVKRGFAKKFDTFSTLQFLLNLPEEEQAKLFAFNRPALYFYDIETEIGNAFPKPQSAAMPINAISTCDEKCNAIIQTTLNLLDDVDLKAAIPNPTIDDAYAFINNIVQTYLDRPCFSSYLKNKPTIKIIEHDNEYELLNFWVTKILKPIPALTGWAINTFDNLYVKNRCKKHGIDLALASPVGRTDYQSGWPKHKYIVDYMHLIDEYDFSIYIKENLKLDYIANRLFNCGKLPYKGGLKELSQERPCTFVAYNCVDTLVNAMIHAKTNCMSNVLGLSAFTNIDLRHCESPVKQSEGVLMTQMLQQYGNKVVVAINSNENPMIRAFEGGFVKTPVKRYAKYCCCCDYASLYPAAMRSLNLSPFNYIKRLKNPTEIEHYKIDPNYTVSVLGGLYKNDKSYQYKEAQVMLGDRRYDEKDAQLWYQNNHVKLIEEELSRRGLRKN